MAVEHPEVGHEADLIVLLWDDKTLCGPFGIVGVLEDTNVTEAFDCGLEKGKK